MAIPEKSNRPHFMAENNGYPKELIRSGLVILKQMGTEFSQDPFYTVMMSTDKDFNPGDKVDIDNQHQVIRRFDDQAILVASAHIYGRF